MGRISTCSSVFRWYRHTRSAVNAPLAALVVAVGTLACSSGTEPDDSFTVTPESATILVGRTQQLTAVGAPGAVSWSSSNSGIASVVPETGFVTGITRGSAIISAQSGGSLASARIVVEVEPIIGLAAPTAEFVMLEGAALPTPVSVGITNDGDRELSGLSAGPIEYGAGQPQGWLSVALSGTVAPATIQLAVTGAMPRGTYTATIPVRSPVATNTPSLVVTLRVQAPPSIVATPASVSMAGIPGDVVNESVAVTNGGDLPLTGLSATVQYQSGQPTGWLSATLTGSQAPSTLDLQGNSAGLAVGQYQATVTLTSTVAGVSPVTVPVELTVNPGPSIQLSRTTVGFGVTQGGSPPSQSVSITNGGGGSLSGLSATVSPPSTTWLSVQLNTTTAPATLTLNVSSASLASGTYNATVSVSSAVASNSPRTISVTLDVGQPPDLVLSPTSFTAVSFQNGNNPGAQAISATNAGGGGSISPLSFQINYNSGSGWLSASWQGNANSTPGVLLLQPITGGLTRGTYTATVTVSGPGVASEVVNVTFVIKSFTVDVFPSFQAEGCGSCHGSAGFQPRTVGVTAATAWTNLQPKLGILVCKITNPSCGGAGAGNDMTMSNATRIQDIMTWIARGAPF